MDFLGIVLGFAVLIVLTYRGWSVYLATFSGAVAVILLSGQPLVETLHHQYIGGIGSIFSSLFGLFLFSSVMAKLYSASGAAYAISYSLCNIFLRRAASPEKKQFLGVLIIILSSALICYGGINAAIVIITIYPIALSTFEVCDIPKRFIPGVILSGCVTFALSGPGSPQPTNLVPASILGTSPSSGLIPGIVGSVVELVVTLLLLNVMIGRAKKRGEHFAYGPKDAAADTKEEQPPFAASLLPLILLFVLFNFLSLDILLCTLISSAASAVLFRPYLPKGKLRSCINEGFISALTPVGSIGAVFGFAACIQQAPSFQGIVNRVLSLGIHPLWLCMIAVALLCALTGGSTTGQSIALPIIEPVLTSGGMSPAVIHRVAAFSATTLDSLPYSGTILMTVAHADLTMKDAYPAIFIATTFATTMASVVVTLLLYWFPGLA